VTAEEPANGGPPAELELRTLYSWRGRVLTKPVPKRSGEVLDDHLTASAEPGAEEAPGALIAEPQPSSLARTPAPSSLSLAAVAAREELSSLAEGAEATSEPSLDELAAEARPEPAPVMLAAAVTARGPAVQPRSEHEELIVFEDRRYRVRGLDKNLAYDLLRVNLLAARGEAMHVDTLDLYSARPRAVFVKQAAIEMKVSEDLVKRDIGRVICRLEELQHERITKALEPKTKDVEVSPQERERALGLLRDPRLVERILEDFAACGVVGEETNKLLGYLAAVSRKLEEPLAVIVQSSSSAGKSWLMEAVLALVPEEERVKYSAMTGQSLFYMGETDLSHKILAIVEEAGAERATYALKLLQSEGELTIASTGKDPATGRMVTQEYRVCGPVMIFLTTTAVQVDEELLNRCLVLTVDEEREQTRAIHRLQRERQTLAGLLARQERTDILALHRNAQRLIRPLLVVNPYAPRLTFLDDRTRMRRDHMKYLTLIRAIALLHQHQRQIKTVEHRGKVVPYIEATLDDIALANRLAHRVLGRSLDELAPQTRQLLMLLDRMVSEGCDRERCARRDYRFSRRAVREYTRLSLSQVYVHVSRLMEYEYVIQHRGGRGQSFEYELVYNGEGQAGEPFLAGLIDVEALAQAAVPASDEPAKTGGYRGLEPTCRPSEPICRGGVGPESAPIREGVGAVNSTPVLEESAENALALENTHGAEKTQEHRRSTTPQAATAAAPR